MDRDSDTLRVFLIGVNASESTLRNLQIEVKLL